MDDFAQKELDFLLQIGGIEIRHGQAPWTFSVWILRMNDGISISLGASLTGYFMAGLTAMVGFWATLSLNIPDFSRYAKSQKDQMIGPKRLE